MKPWQVRGWVIPPAANGQFVAAMEEVLDVYKRPYARRYPVVCMDESPKQLIRETGCRLKCGEDSPLDVILNMNDAGM